ncbi:trimeric intracellular cation channel family protein [Methylobacterium fujisawaense]|uniref:trimeric intracellular cation channel family protein n=1 Tax=Methylobacterium fujisawaense TaxID=107400 RepID=UPI0036FCCB02
MESELLLVRVLDLVGTFVFAVSGAALGVEKDLDLFGVLVLAFVTAVVGGITRDVLIGAIPPASIASWHNLALAVVAGVLVFRMPRLFDRLHNPVLVFDAVGLGVFAVAGTQKALDHGINWPMSAVLGMLSAIGGGMVRDSLTAQVPTVLRSEIHAVAALAGGLSVVVGGGLGLPTVPVALAGTALCVFLRLMALYRGWRLPVASFRSQGGRGAGPLPPGGP